MSLKLVKSSESGLRKYPALKVFPLPLPLIEIKCRPVLYI